MVARQIEGAGVNPGLRDRSRPGTTPMQGRAQREAVGATRPDASATARFTRGITSFSGFGGIGDPERFVSLPDDWSIGVADVVASTEAIAAGRYKSVNTAGAAVVSAVSNALGTLDFPFIFAGDGASFAVAPEEAAAAGLALAATVAWVGAELGLHLRGAMLPVAAVRAEGFDVQVARFAASPDATYAMFAGGGLAWAEQSLKAGRIALPPAPSGARPDLSGLSCRFRDIKSKNGVILSLLVRPAGPPEEAQFRTLIADLLAISEEAPGSGRPMPVFGPLGGVDFTAVPRHARFQRQDGSSRAASLVRTLGEFILAAVVLATGATLGGFSARRYLQEVVANSDFRKYDDGLMMTLDCSAAVADSLTERLGRAQQAGVAAYGLHRQKAATVTCVVPSATASNHVHFIDGATGGYAMAASDLKSRLASMGEL